MLRRIHGTDDAVGRSAGAEIVGCTFVDESQLLVSIRWGVVLYNVSQDDDDGPTRVRQWSVAAVESERLTTAAVGFTGEGSMVVVAAQSEVVRCFNAAESKGARAPGLVKSLHVPAKGYSCSSLVVAALADGRLALFSTNNFELNGQLHCVHLLKQSSNGLLLECRFAAGAERSREERAASLLETAALRSTGDAGHLIFRGVAPQKTKRSIEEDVLTACCAVKHKKGTYHLEQYSWNNREQSVDTKKKKLQSRASSRKRQRRGAAASTELVQEEQTSEPNATSSRKLVPPEAGASLVALTPLGPLLHLLWKVKGSYIWCGMRGDAVLFSRSCSSSLFATLEHSVVAAVNNDVIELWGGCAASSRLMEVSTTSSVVGLAGRGSSVAVLGKWTVDCALGLTTDATAASAVGSSEACSSFEGTFPTEEASRLCLTSDWKVEAPSSNKKKTALVGKLEGFATANDRSGFEEACAKEDSSSVVGVILAIAKQEPQTKLWRPFAGLVKAGRLSFDAETAELYFKSLFLSSEGVEVMESLLSTDCVDLLPESSRVALLRFAVEARALGRLDDTGLDSVASLIANIPAGRPHNPRALRVLATVEAALLIQLMLKLGQTSAIPTPLAAAWIEAILDAKFVELSLRAAADENLRGALEAARTFAESQIDATASLLKLGATLANASQEASMPTKLAPYVLEEFQLR